MADLPDDLALPLASGEQWWYWLGGRPSIDFVNTLRERWWRRVETLVTPADLVRWLELAGLLDRDSEVLPEPGRAERAGRLDPGSEILPETRRADRAGRPARASAALRTASAAQLRAAQELRESIDAALVAVIAGKPVPASALATIDGWLPAAVVPERLTASGGGVPVLGPSPPADPVRHALGALALDAARMLGTSERERLRICASETCSARFYDRSPAAGRVWCSMRGCGNAAKARRHRERARGTRGSAGASDHPT